MCLLSPARTSSIAEQLRLLKSQNLLPGAFVEEQHLVALHSCSLPARLARSLSAQMYGVRTICVIHSPHFSPFLMKIIPLIVSFG